MIRVSLGLAALLAAPSSAAAATLFHDGWSMRYEADPAGDLRLGESNTLEVKISETKLASVPYPQRCFGFPPFCMGPTDYYDHGAVVSDPADEIKTMGDGCCGQSLLGQAACRSRSPSEVDCRWVAAGPGTPVAVWLGDGPDTATVVGTAAATLYGGAAADRLTGAGARDFIYGHAGSDILSGGGGADLLSGDDGGDTLTGGGGEDLLAGDHGDDYISARDGLPDQVICGPGTDTVMADPPGMDTLRDCEDVQYAATP